MRWNWFAATLLLTAAGAGAGCLAQPAADVESSSLPAAAPQDVAESPTEVLVASGTLTEARLGFSSPGASLYLDGVAIEEENTRGTFAPDGGLSAIVVELVWEDPVYDLDLVVWAPDVEQHAVPEVDGFTLTDTTGHVFHDQEGNAGSPDGHAVVRVLDPEALALDGEWTWRVGSKSAVDVGFDVYVSLFHGAPPHRDYSAPAAAEAAGAR